MGGIGVGSVIEPPNQPRELDGGVGRLWVGNVSEDPRHTHPALYEWRQDPRVPIMVQTVEPVCSRVGWLVEIGLEWTRIHGHTSNHNYNVKSESKPVRPTRVYATKALIDHVYL